MDRCLRALKPDGILFVKENICKQGAVPDAEDASVTRSDELMRRLFERAGAATTATGAGGGGGGGGGGGTKPKWRLVHNVKQRDFPKNLFEVRMYVLRPVVEE
jgi:protein N-terminal methyltransferase